MAAKDPQRRRESAQTAIRARWDRSAPQRASAALNDWVDTHAAKLEPFTPHEAAAVGHLAAIIDARLAQNEPEK